VASVESRRVRAPLTDAMLAPLEPECRWVDINGRLTDEDAARVAGLMYERPEVHLTVGSSGLRVDPVTNLDFLRFFPWLTWLNVTSHYLQNISGLAGLSQLRRLNLDVGVRTISAAPLAATASSLRELSLEGPVSKAGALSELTGVVELTLRSVRMPDLAVLTSIAGLRSLDLELGGTRDLSLLSAFTHLEYFQARLVRGLADVSPLGDVLSLQSIFLEALRNVTQLPSLAKLTRLQTVTLRTMKGLTDLIALLTAPALEDVSLSLAQLQPEDIAPLAAHPTLKTAHVYLGSDRKDALAYAALEARGIRVRRPSWT
jgi:hypothetical protein